ncbi:hypothetical protein H312_03208, partial [Anncaliia algerae PRA339]
MLHRDLVKKTLDIKSTIEWMLEKKYINEFQNCHKCSNEQMRIKFKDELYFFKCTKCD